MPRLKGVWKKLKFWQTGEWDVIKEKLDDCDKNGHKYNPHRSRIFASLECCPFDATKVCILGQDPYPNPKDACGLAFSSLDTRALPATLEVIYKEYQDDLKYPKPTTGDLSKWAEQGVLLWNVIPTCYSYNSLSHESWHEWKFLTQEILETLSKETTCIFVALGRYAKDYTDTFISEDDSDVLYYSHPSPRASRASKHPFLGCRMFTTINGKLCQQGQEPIDWRLP